MKGRKPIPIEQRKKEGTLVPSRHGTEAVVLAGRSRPPIPPDMEAEALEIFELIVDDLEDSGVLDAADGTAIEAAATMLHRARDARRLIAEDGLLVIKEKFDKEGNLIEEQVPHPALKIEKESWSLWLKFAEQLGLSPSARTRLGLQRVVGMDAAARLKEKLGDNPMKARPADAEGEVISET